MDGTNYPSDVTDGQSQVIRTLLPAKKKRGRPPVDRRMIINAILYVNRTGCQWRALPHDFPKWKTVYTVFWRWRKQGLWQKINDTLRERVRVAAGKKATPTAAVIDSQSVKTTEVGGEERGYDAGKKISGRKRHIVVDTLGLVLAVVVHGAYRTENNPVAFLSISNPETDRKRVRRPLSTEEFALLLETAAKAKPVQCISGEDRVLLYILAPKRTFLGDPGSFMVSVSTPFRGETAGSCQVANKYVAAQAAAKYNP